MLEHFVNKEQLQVLQANCYGEEGEHFAELITTLEETIRQMPKTYETEGTEDPVVVLHYFRGGFDAWITEKDCEVEQCQAFGKVDLGQGAELGYISIKELIENGFEIDLYWEQVPLSKVG